jgi:sulfite reductase (NADPH) flavoprotein alpha-component
VPGGKETARMLKALNEERRRRRGASPRRGSGARGSGAGDHGGAGRSRDNPVPAT